MQPLRCYIKHTCTQSWRNRGLHTGWLTRRPSVTLGVRALERDALTSGPRAWRFHMPHLPHSVTQRSSFARSASAWVCLWNAETEPKNHAICFMCSRLKPPTQQQQQQTTGVHSHICYRDLGQYHFIVWHTICIKQQFSVPTGLAWLKAVSDVQRGVLYAVPQHCKLSQLQVYYCHPYCSPLQAHTACSLCEKLFFEEIS